jgi:DNA-binding beta-propeller fold protein YncE
MTMKRRMLVPLTAATAACSCGAQPQPSNAGPAPLALERTITLPNVTGRIDHLDYDPQGRRLFVAALGNGTVEAIDLASNNVVGRIAGLSEPQGVAWLESVHELAVASADGSLRFYDGALRPVAVMNLGGDADNLRVDPRSGALIVGFGTGAIATVDPTRHTIVRSLALPAHPEGFRLDGDKIYVNLPDAGRIVAGDLASGTVTARWSTGLLRRLNFPMAFEPSSRAIAVAFRLPARLAIIDPSTGAYRQILATCGDSDDLFFDVGRHRLYVVCGSGDVDTFEAPAGSYARMARIPTRGGARTGLFVPEEDRLFVAARNAEGQPAAILVLRPTSPQDAAR